MVLKKYINIKPIYLLLCASIVLGTVILDLITKKLVMLTMNLGESIPLIPGVINLTFITNLGAAFGSFAEHRWVFMTLSTLMILAIIVLILIWDKPKPTFYVGASMVLGGGIGNMIDRIAYGYVVDFIDFCAFPEIWHWIFNGADSFVCIGAVILGIYYVTDFTSTSVKTGKVAHEVAVAEHEEAVHSVEEDTVTEETVTAVETTEAVSEPEGNGDGQ